MGSSAHLRKGLAIWDDITIIQNFYNYGSKVTFLLDVLRIDLIAILPSGIGIWVSKFLWLRIHAKEAIHSLERRRIAYRADRDRAGNKWLEQRAVFGISFLEISGDSLGSEGERFGIFPGPERNFQHSPFHLHMKTLWKWFDLILFYRYSVS